jgi:hypothetical protein
MSQKEPKHAFSSNNFCLVNTSTVVTLQYRVIQQARLTLSHVYNEATTEPTMAKNTSDNIRVGAEAVQLTLYSLCTNPNIIVILFTPFHYISTHF